MSAQPSTKASEPSAVETETPGISADIRNVTTVSHAVASTSTPSLHQAGVPAASMCTVCPPHTSSQSLPGTPGMTTNFGPSHRPSKSALVSALWLTPEVRASLSAAGLNCSPSGAWHIESQVLKHDAVQDLASKLPSLPPPVRVTVSSTSLRKQQHNQLLLQNHQQGLLLPATGHLQELAPRKRFREAPMTAGSLANQQSNAGVEDNYENEDTRCTKKRVGGCARGPTSRSVRRDTVVPEEKSVIFGTFYPDRYLLEVDCILVEGCGFVSRSKFEKLGGSLMAKWYRSIRVVETAETLGAWLERHRITVVTGKTRQSRKRQVPNGMVEDNANANTPSPIIRDASCHDKGGDVRVASQGGGDGVTTAAVEPLTSPNHPAECVPHIEAGLSVGGQDLWPALWSFGCGTVCPPSQPSESEVLAAAGGATLPQPHLAGSGGVEADSMLSPTLGAWASGSTAAEVVATASAAATVAVACTALTTLDGFVGSSSDVSAVRSNYTGVETLPHGDVSPGVYSICGRAALGCLAATTVPQLQEYQHPSIYTVQPPQLHTAAYSVDYNCTGSEEWLERDGSVWTNQPLQLQQQNQQLQQQNQQLQQLPQLQQQNQQLQQLPQLQQQNQQLYQLPHLLQQNLHLQQLPHLQQHNQQLQQPPQLQQHSQQLQLHLQQQYSADGWQPSDHNALSGACSDPWSPPAPPAQLSPYGDQYMCHSPCVYQERYPRIFPIRMDAPPAGFSPQYETTAHPAPSAGWMPMACPPPTDPDPWAGRVDTAAGVPFAMVCGLAAAAGQVSTAGPALCSTDVDVMWESFQRWSEEEADVMPQGQ